jgi:hypothetical protein
MDDDQDANEYHRRLGAVIAGRYVLGDLLGSGASAWRMLQSSDRPDAPSQSSCRGANTDSPAARPDGARGLPVRALQRTRLAPDGMKLHWAQGAVVTEWGGPRCY